MCDVAHHHTFSFTHHRSQDSTHPRRCGSGCGSPSPSRVSVCLDSVCLFCVSVYMRCENWQLFSSLTARPRRQSRCAGDGGEMSDWDSNDGDLYERIKYPTCMSAAQR